MLFAPKPKLGATSSIGSRQYRLPRLTTKKFTPTRLHSRLVITNYQVSFDEIKSAGDQAYNRACELLPALEIAQRVAREAREPAAEAERNWQDAHNRLSDIAGKAHAVIDELRGGAESALGGGPSVTDDMLRIHARSRLESFRSSLPDVSVWQRFKPTISKLDWLPGAAVLTQAAACASQEVPYLVACISVAMPPFHEDNLRSLLLHWSVADGPTAGWANYIPQGWHTSPGISQPCGATAWQTTFGPHAPVLDGQAATSAPIFSIVVQIPMQEGFLEGGGGIKFVLMRSDGGQPEWIKPHNNADFWLDFAHPIDLFKNLRAKAEEEPEVDGGAVDAADSLDQWGWARAMASEDSASDGNSTSASDGSENIAAAVAAKQEQSEAEARELKLKESFDEDSKPTGWLERVSEWQLIGDFPPQQPLSLSKQVQQLRLILAAAQSASGGGDEGAERAQKIGELLQKCHEVDETLQIYDSLSLQARHAQQEKDRLWEMHKSASDDASKLMAEVGSALDGARKSVASLRGRPSEVTRRDLESVALQMAAQTSAGGNGASALWPFSAFSGDDGRQLAFLSQSTSAIAGIDANVVVQVHLEGEKKAVQKALSPKKESDESSQEESSSASDEEISSALATEAALMGQDASAIAAAASPAVPAQPKPPRSPAFDTIVISVCVAESFPNDSLHPPLLLHFGVVQNQHGKWRPPPSGWKCQPVEGTGEGAPAPAAPGSLPWVPFHQFTITKKDGNPVFVDPMLNGLCLRFPLAEMAVGGLRGIEFVLKSRDGGWLQPASGGNFYVELPLMSGN